VRAVVEHALAPFREGGRVRFLVSGPDIGREAGKSLTLAMVLHELGTNAVKYGALSNETGRIDVRWQIADNANGRRLKLVWQEMDGPPVRPPVRKGFGSALIERALEGDRGSARVEYTPSGLVCALEIAL
jgi:two-component sensor histidine kinase